MSKVNYIGKCLLLKEENKKILVIGDLHLGYEGSLRRSGVFIERGLFEENLKYLDKVFEKIGKIEEIVLLGDVKHEFGKILWEERIEIKDFLEYIFRKSKKIIIVKGNHDKIVEYVPNVDKVLVVDYYISGENCFLHGDKDFDSIRDKKIKKLPPAISNSIFRKTQTKKRIKRWIMGHAHPAIKLREGVKLEKFKCFLTGKFKGKEIIIVPSFFEGNEGSDVRENDLRLAWNFKLKKFKVKVVQEDSLETLDFGILGKI